MVRPDGHKKQQKKIPRPLKLTPDPPAPKSHYSSKVKPKTSSPDLWDFRPLALQTMEEIIRTSEDLTLILQDALGVGRSCVRKWTGESDPRDLYPVSDPLDPGKVKFYEYFQFGINFCDGIRDIHEILKYFEETHGLTDPPEYFSNSTDFFRSSKRILFIQTLTSIGMDTTKLKRKLGRFTDVMKGHLRSLEPILEKYGSEPLGISHDQLQIMGRRLGKTQEPLFPADPEPNHDLNSPVTSKVEEGSSARATDLLDQILDLYPNPNGNSNSRKISECMFILPPSLKGSQDDLTCLEWSDTGSRVSISTNDTKSVNGPLSIEAELALALVNMNQIELKLDPNPADLLIHHSVSTSIPGPQIFTITSDEEQIEEAQDDALNQNQVDLPSAAAAGDLDLDPGPSSSPEGSLWSTTNTHGSTERLQESLSHSSVTSMTSVTSEVVQEEEPQDRYRDRDLEPILFLDLPPRGPDESLIKGKFPIHPNLFMKAHLYHFRALVTDVIFKVRVTEATLYQIPPKPMSMSTLTSPPDLPREPSSGPSSTLTDFIKVAIESLLNLGSLLEGFESEFHQDDLRYLGRLLGSIRDHGIKFTETLEILLAHANLGSKVIRTTLSKFATVTDCVFYEAFPHPHPGTPEEYRINYKYQASNMYRIEKAHDIFH